MIQAAHARLTLIEMIDITRMSCPPMSDERWELVRIVITFGLFYPFVLGVAYALHRVLP